MKQYQKIFPIVAQGFALLLAVGLTTACTEKIDEIAETATLTISAYPETNAYGTAPHTKAVLDEDNGVSFVSTDALAVFDGTLHWCWWLEKDKENPVFKCSLSGSITNCYCYPTLNADTPNNRRTGSDGNGGKEEVLTTNNTQWTPAQWRSNTVAWTGGSKYGQVNNTLDLDF